MTKSVLLFRGAAVYGWRGMRSVGLWRHFRALRAEYFVGGALCLLLVGVWAGATVMSQEGKRDTMARAETQARDLAEVLSLEWSDTIHRIEYLQYLGRVVTIATLSGDPKRPEILGALREAAKIAGSGIIQVCGIDAAGDVIWSATPLPCGKINPSGREHFRAIAQQGPERFIEHPVVGAASGQQTLEFTEAVRSADRTLEAITVVSVNFDKVLSRERRLARIGRGVMTIERSDGLILAHSQELLQTSLPSSDFGRMVARNGAASGLIKSQIDGVARFYAARWIPSYEMVLNVGLDADEQMAPAAKASRQIYRVAAWLAFSLVLLALAIIFAIRRQRDVEAVRLRANELEQSEMLLRQIAEPANDLISLHDPEFRFIYANPACQTILGFAADSLLGLRLPSIALSADLPSVEAELDSLSAEGGSRRIAMRINRAGGEVRWLESEIVQIERPNDRLHRIGSYIVISRDITQQVRDGEVLREVEQEFAALAALAPGRLYRILFSSDGTRRIRFPGQGTLFGYSQKHLEDPDFHSSKMETHDTLARAAAIAECLRRRYSVVEYRFQAATGDIRWVRDEMRLTTCQGDECFIVGYMSDITAERDSQVRMQQIERLATLGEIASGIAHEMNHPLAVIATAAENALRIGKRNGNLDPVIMGKLQRIMDQAHRAGTVIDHIRRIGSGQSDLSGESDLADIIQSAMLLVQHRLQLAGINIVIDLAPDLPKLDVPAVPLEQVLLNLVINACDAYNSASGWRQTSEDERPIHITADASEAVIQIRVIDRAGGVPSAVASRIFDPFFTTKPPGKGSGLGLSICLASVIEMGGTLTVHNENGGATFEIELPRRPVLHAPLLLAPERPSTTMMGAS